MRFHGDRAVRTFSCAEQFRALAFAQLTYREEFARYRGIALCAVGKASYMGFRDPVRRTTLAHANEPRDWRIYAEFAQRLITEARRLYVGESLPVDLTNTVYVLDSTTIDLCMSVFPGHISERPNLP